MEQSDKLIELRQAVCDYYGIEYALLDSKSRKTPIPYMKKVVSYFAFEYLSITQTEIASHFKQKHSNINIHIKTFKEYLEVSQRIKNEVKDMERVLTERGIWKGKIQNRRYYSFVDLNNCIVASNDVKQIIFVNQSVEEIRKMLGEEWKLEIHNNTRKIFYATINKHIKQNENENI